MYPFIMHALIMVVDIKVSFFIINVIHNQQKLIIYINFILKWLID